MPSGKGYEGTKPSIADFAEYLTNELELPNVDETGLSGYYDIKTKREMPVIVYHK